MSGQAQSSGRAMAEFEALEAASNALNSGPVNERRIQRLKHEIEDVCLLAVEVASTGLRASSLADEQASKKELDELIQLQCGLEASLARLPAHNPKVAALWHTMRELETLIYGARYSVEHRPGKDAAA